MIVEDQSDVIAFLERPETHGISETVDRTETHISEVFLAGDRAYKLKRAVKLPYVDFSTPDLRRAMCDREVALNRRTAPALYRGVRLVTREADGSLAFEGTGTLVDAVVEMVRFDEATLFDRMAVEGRLSASLMRRTADAIAAFLVAAETVTGVDGAALMAGVLDINERGFATGKGFTPAEIAAFCERFRDRLARHSTHLDRRSAAGLIRLAHGDLHLRNICLFDGEPTLFDCIEFNDQIATVDQLYDLAYLVMDLWHRELFDFANLVANRAIDRLGDDDGFSLFPFFMAVRSAVRAHVTATQIAEAAKPDAHLFARARSYFDLALALLEPRAPMIVAIGGLSGSGKSTVADRLAPRLGAPPGARILESDRIRKALYGVSPETILPDTAYDEAISMRVYATIATRAGDGAQAGVTVVADAVYSDPQHRAALENAARDAGVPFIGIWLDAAPDTLRRRVTERAKGASDAGLAVLEKQILEIEPPSGWHSVTADGTVEDSVGAIVDVVGASSGG